MKTALRWKVQDEYQRPKQMNNKYRIFFVGDERDQYRTTDGLWVLNATNPLILDSYDEAAVIRDFLIRDERINPADIVIRSDY